MTNNITLEFAYLINIRDSPSNNGSINDMFTSVKDDHIIQYT